MKRFQILGLVILLIAIVSAGYFKYREYRETDNTGPELTVSEDVLEVSIEAEESELLAGVTASDSKDGDVTDSLVIEGISSFIDDRRIVTYAAFDQDKNVGKASRQIRYTDYEHPKFALEEPLMFPVGYDTNFLKGITASDCIDGDITMAVCLSKGYTLYSDVAGDYPVQVEVTNSSGDTSVLPVTITIYDPAEYSRSPKIILEDYILYIAPGEEPDLEAYISEADDHGKDAIDDVEIDDSLVAYDTPGTYEVLYSLENEDGYIGTVRLILVVQG